MAKIGLKYPVYKTDSAAGVIGKAIQADISITVNDVKLYADDAVAESDKSFQNGNNSELMTCQIQFRPHSWASVSRRNTAKGPTTTRCGYWLLE